MHTLILDTSTERGIVGLYCDDVLANQTNLPFGLQTSTYLMPAIEQIFTAAAITPHQLRYIAVGIGPGSYTGIRVAVSIAKGISYACHIPLVGFCSLYGFIPSNDASFAAMIDGKIGGIYLLQGIAKNGHISYASQPTLQSPDTLNDILAHVEVIVTPNQTALKTRINHPHIRWEETYPSLSHLHSTAETLYQQGHYTLDTTLDILYMRETWLKKE